MEISKWKTKTRWSRSILGSNVEKWNWML